MEYIAHHGIKGQKWGVRRYQNTDGSLTPEGRKHYGIGDIEVFEKGSSVRRITSIDYDDTKSKRMYTYGKESSDTYEENASNLPSVNPSYGSRAKKAKVTQYEFNKDVTVLKGDRAVSDYMKQFGSMTMKEFERASPIGELSNPFEIQSLIDKHGNEKVSDVYNKYKTVDLGKRFANGYMRFSTHAIADGEDWKKEQPKKNIDVFIDKYKNLGFDVIVDPEDFSAGFNETYIVINKDAIKNKGSYKIKLK